MSYSEVGVVDVSELLLDISGAPLPCCLLIGAGVSKSAGIGLASDFVATIMKQHPAAYKRARASCPNGAAPDYGECMGMLTPAQQTALVRGAIERATVNWAHIGIALLEANGFIDSILTTNFDPLASRACALFNRFPAIYDLAGLRDAEGGGGLQFDRSFVSGPAIYHLHGQHTGFLLLNTEDKLKAQAERIAPVLNATMIGKLVIVCGYSGDNDPLVDKIAALGPFPHGLVWVTHDDKPPSQFVCERLLNRFEYCYLVRNVPSDSFFELLFRALNIDPPLFLAKPFDHMLEVLKTLSPAKPLADAPDLVAAARERLVKARESELSANPGDQTIYTLAAAQKNREILDQFGDPAVARELNDEARNMVAWAAISLGNELSDRANRPGEMDTEALFDAAIAYYRQALDIEPANYKAMNNLGNAIRSKAELMDAPLSAPDWDQAEELLLKSLEINGDGTFTWNNLGNVYYCQAERAPVSAAPRLFRKAIEKYRRALALDPDYSTAYVNLGGALVGLSRLLPVNKQKTTLRDAQKALTRAEKLEPGSASYNLACMAAKLGDFEQIRRWLTAAKDREVLPDCATVWSDADFAAIRHDERFVALMVELGCGDQPPKAP